jgi:CO/xanthine dehydrogenase FAD-binding subunit
LYTKWYDKCCWLREQDQGALEMVTFYRRLPKFNYLAPRTIGETLSLLSQYKGGAKIMAGGTDLVPKLKRREVKAPEYVIDLKGVPNLDYIKYEEDNGLKLGALTTIRAVATSAIIQDKFSILFQAANSMACVQVRNRGTLAGNICNAVPSADTAPALLTLAAKVKLISLKGERFVNVEDFFVGPGETVLNDDEILGEIQVPSLPPQSRGVYLKLTPRRSMDLAIVGVAVVLIPDEGICKDIRIALGAVSPTPIRAKKAETAIRGHPLQDGVVEKAARVAAEECHPISDHRASAEYRTEMVRVLAKRAIKKAIS